MLPNKENFVCLDMYSKEFRQGYDACNLLFGMLTVFAREKLREEKEFGSSIEPSHREEMQNAPVVVKIHKDNIPLCQGILAENMFSSKMIELDIPYEISFKKKDEVFLSLSKIDIKKK